MKRFRLSLLITPTANLKRGFSALQTLLSTFSLLFSSLFSWMRNTVDPKSLDKLRLLLLLFFKLAWLNYLHFKILEIKHLLFLFFYHIFLCPCCLMTTFFNISHLILYETLCFSTQNTKFHPWSLSIPRHLPNI